MATLDSLEPQRRAILELLLRQGKGYDDLGGLLDMPGGRVRELAREALVSLEPGGARRVDEDWRGQVADYVLGQQGGPEARATRGHLKRSEPARTWVASLLDSLDPLYGEGARPDMPEPEGGRAARPSGGGGGHLAAGAPAGAAATAGRAGRREEPEDADAQETEAEQTTTAREPSPADGSAAAPAAGPSRGHTASASEREVARPGALSPEAEAVRRRQVIGGALAAGALLIAVVLAIALIGGGEKEEEEDKARSQVTGGQSAAQAEAQTRLVGQGRLASVGTGNAEGVAVIAERGGENQLLVQARGLEPSGRRTAYEVWLYNSRRDAVSLGGQVTDQSGGLQGAGPLPPEFRTYRFIDVSREKIDRNAEHSGESVLRVPVSDVLRAADASGEAGPPAVPGGGAAP